MGKQGWSLEDGDNGFWITRVVDTGAKDADGNPVLSKRSTYREDPVTAINEIRASLDVLQKELLKEYPTKQPQAQKGK